MENFGKISKGKKDIRNLGLLKHIAKRFDLKKFLTT
jgi:hypothetical protein